MGFSKTRAHQKARFEAIPAQVLNERVQACTESLTLAEQQKTKPLEMAAWEQVTLAEIQAKRDLLRSYLDRAFDQRAQNFKWLFKVVDRALDSQDHTQLA